MMFQDRKDAGQKLAQELLRYRGKDAVVLALPRGGVVLGYEIAKALELPLDIVVTRKIGHPNNPEYAICAVDEKGELFCNEAEAGSVDQNWLKAEVSRQKNEAKRRIKVYRDEEKQKELSGKTVILVDDGIATGLTIHAALQSILKERPKEIVVAVPVAPNDVVADLRGKADDVVTLDNGEHYLGAVGAYYNNFPQVSDGEVIKLLKQAKK
ncbi:MAG TPA: phosphoribosyltransferase family protein [Candidatus Paceibacterota bacterium]